METYYKNDDNLHTFKINGKTISLTIEEVNYLYLLSKSIVESKNISNQKTYLG